MTGLRSRIAAVLVGLLTSCIHTRHVGDEGDDRESQTHKGTKGEEGASSRVTTERVPPRGDRPAVSASPEGLMNPGSARKVQEALRRSGYLNDASGELDTTTSAALRRFQHDHGLAATGAPDRETLRSLGIDPSDVYQTGTGTTQHQP